MDQRGQRIRFSCDHFPGQLAKAEGGTRGHRADGCVQVAVDRYGLGEIEILALPLVFDFLVDVGHDAALTVDPDAAFWFGAARIDVRGDQIGRASCRERVCQSVSISGVAVLLKKKNQFYREKLQNIYI